MFVVLRVKHKCSSALVLLANNLGRPMSITEMVLKGLLSTKLLATSLLNTDKGLFFEVYSLDVSGQGACGIEHNSALGKIAL